MEISNKELNILADREFLIHKNILIKKINSLFEQVRTSLFNTISNSKFIFDKDIDIEFGKIFKGEDYKALPYIVLDFPKHFSNSNIFAFRTMFWWGNFFSTTIHLQGKSLQKYRQLIIKNSSLILDNKTYFCVNDTPWEYDYSPNNYVLLNENNLSKINEMKFLKISKKHDLSEYDQLPELAASFLIICLDLLSAK